MTDTPKTDRNPTEIEITPKMIEAAQDIILIQAGYAGAEIPAAFDPRDLAAQVYRAMSSAALRRKLNIAASRKRKSKAPSRKRHTI